MIRLTIILVIVAAVAAAVAVALTRRHRVTTIETRREETRDEGE